MQEKFLIGTYTNHTSKGIYTITLNHCQKQLEDLQLIIVSQRPSYLQQVNTTIFTVKQEYNLGGIASYCLSQAPATLLDTQLSAGAPPAYLSYDAGRQLIYSANYHRGTVTVFKINIDKTLIQTDMVTHQGLTGPRPEQATPHPHYADLTPDQRLVVCDLGMDLLVTYNVSDTGKLTQMARYQSAAGFGTRHLVFHPNGQFAYIIGELSSKLEALKYNADSGSFRHLQTISTVPSKAGKNLAAAIHISSDGRFIYASNRGENTIAVFAIQKDFTVKHIQTITTAGVYPRDFNFSQDEKFLLAANQNSNTLTLYDRNPVTGKLTLIQQDINCPEPVCVKPWIRD